jgi:16S rRNA (guanine527-N7)-methyltransferase
VADLKLLQAGACEIGAELNREQLSAFSLYMNELLRWNQRANLTAITAPDEIQTKHFLDSLTCLLAFPGAEPPVKSASNGGLLERLNRGAGLSCIDVGAGAGFPGLPLKICLPEMKLTMVDSVGKKTNFLSHITALLKLDGVRVLNARSEELARQPEERESYDVVVARALSKLVVLAELCIPFCRVGGRVIAPKKGELNAEMNDARYAVEKLGGVYRDLIPIRLSLLEEERYLVRIDKVSPTPLKYPRRAGLPAKRPLMGGNRS